MLLKINAAANQFELARYQLELELDKNQK